MENNQQRAANSEVVVKAANGWPMLGLSVSLGIAGVAGIPFGASQNQPLLMVVAVVVTGLGCIAGRVIQFATERGAGFSSVRQLPRHCP